MPKKIYADGVSTLAGVAVDSMTVMRAGLVCLENPENLIAALRETGVGSLTIISSDWG